MTDQRWIGVFDSGLGGMTVVRALLDAFPKEGICYLGDTARVPYGTKSPETVLRYAEEDIGFLLECGVKMVVAACNTVSAVALPALVGRYEVPVLGVVEVGAEVALEDPGVRRVGVIGTGTTIASGAYRRALEERRSGLVIVEKACPLFVPLIEEGWIHHPVTRAVVREYLEGMREAEIDTLILGCTHYPLLKPVLQDFFGERVRLVDSAGAVVGELDRWFGEGRVGHATGGRGEGEASKFYVTDRCNHFQRLVEAFLGVRDVDVEQIGEERLSAARRNAVGRTG